MDRLYRQTAWPSKKLPFGILPSRFAKEGRRVKGFGVRGSVKKSRIAHS